MGKLKKLKWDKLSTTQWVSYSDSETFKITKYFNNYTLRYNQNSSAHDLSFSKLASAKAVAQLLYN